MSLKDIKFNHAEDNFHAALGISNETKIICRERIFFASFSNSLQADELFDDIDEAPKEFRTVTGDLQRLLSMISNPVEYDYTLLTFTLYQRMAKEVYNFYKQADENSAKSTEDRIKMEILKGILKLKDLKDREESGENHDDNDIDVISKESINERIKLVKKSGYNFDKYLSLVKTNINMNSSMPSGNIDISDLLSGLFSDDDKDS